MSPYKTTAAFLIVGLRWIQYSIETSLRAPPVCVPKNYFLERASCHRKKILLKVQDLYLQPYQDHPPASHPALW